MSIQNSINFISFASQNSEFRNLLNTQNPKEITEHLASKGYVFTPFEFEESINLLHVKMQFEEQANRLFEVVNWYKMLINP